LWWNKRLGVWPPVGPVPLSLLFPANCPGKEHSLSSPNFFSFPAPDKFHQTCVIIGFAILFPLTPKIKDHVGVCFFAVILFCIGLYHVVPGCSAWISNNLAGPAKRAIGLAFAFALCNVGSIGGSYIYVASEAPSYPAGFGCSLGFSAMGMVAVVLLVLNYGRINAKRDKMNVEWVQQEYTEDRLAEMGDRSPLFRYTR